MNKILTIIFISSFFFSCNEKTEEKPEELILGIYVQDQKYDQQDVILIGKVKSDTIEKITDWDDTKKDYVENRLPFLKKYNEFYVYSNPTPITLSFDTIRKKDFQCSELTVGHSNKFNLKINDEFSICTNYKGFKNYKNNEIEELNDKSFEIVKDKLRKTLEDSGVEVTSGFDNNYQTMFKNIRISILQSTDLDNNGIKEFVVKGTIEEQYKKNSIILVFNITDDYIKDIGQIEAWSKGYNLIGVTDLNENGKYELIFQGVGYESIGFEIYEITNNGFKQLLYTVPYGC